MTDDQLNAIRRSLDAVRGLPNRRMDPFPGFTDLLLDEVDRLRAELAAASAAIGEAAESLIWMSGSADFAPEGRAGAAFRENVAPLIQRLIRIGRGEHKESGRG